MVKNWRIRLKTTMYRSVAVVGVFCLLFANVQCFNLETKIVTVHRGPEKSMFGFSVAQHRDQNMKWVLVGAPEAQTKQPGTIQGGAVYRCRPSLNKTECHTIPFDVTGAQTEWNGERYVPIENKSGQWLGASVDSSDTGVIVACAPRYVYYSRTFDKREPIGACFVSVSSSPRFRKYTPCKTVIGIERVNGQSMTKPFRALEASRIPVLALQSGFSFTAYSGFDLQGFCQAGISAALNSDGSRLFMGAVGSWYWQGQMFQQQLYGGSDFIETPESGQYDDYGYLGYSTAVGEFNGDTYLDVAAGMPRSASLSGKVVLFDDRLNVMLNITGDQQGSYFGYSLVVLDINNDGLDDIIVGAPMYSNLKAGMYDTGRVYIFFQSNDPVRFNQDYYQILEGHGHRSRFGLSVAKLGDVNLDGYQDLVVGAPYDGKDHNGAVYIYHGERDGVRTKPAQIIYASTIDVNIRSFGFSVAGGVDVDNNSFPDLSVGAPMSDQSLTFRSRPIIRLGMTLTITPDVINIKDPSMPCRLADGTLVACLTVKSCVNFTAIGIDVPVEMDVIWELDSLVPYEKRTFFWSDEGKYQQKRSIRVQKGDTMCSTTQIYLATYFRDKLTPVVVKLTYSLLESLKVRGLKPMLDVYTGNSVLARGHIRKNCGGDHICIPDLVVKAKAITEVHVIGSEKTVEFAADISNKGEDAFETKVYIELPPSMSFINIYNVQSKTKISCSTENSMLTCDLGNPLPARAKLEFSIRCSPKTANYTQPRLRFNFHVNSTNPDSPASVNDNFNAVDIPLKVVANLQFTGISKPEQVLYNETMVQRSITHELEIGPEVVHLYQLRNLGPSSVSKTSIQILWPSRYNKQHLMYLSEAPVIIRGMGECKVKEDVNPEKLELLYHPIPFAVPHQLAIPDRLETIDDTNRREKRQQASSSSGERQRRSVTIPHGETPIMTEHKVVTAPSTLTELVCNDTWCNVIECETGFMKNEDSILIKVKSRIWLNTLMENKWDDVILTSKAVALVMEVPYNIPASEYSADAFQVSTYFNSGRLAGAEKVIPLWIIGISVGIGLMILIFIALLLWKCGFFVRLKHPKYHVQARLSKADELEDSQAEENILKISTKNGSTYTYDFTDGSEI